MSHTQVVVAVLLDEFITAVTKEKEEFIHLAAVEEQRKKVTGVWVRVQVWM